MKKLKLLVLFTFILGIQYQAFSQCRNFTKRNCLEELTPYISNGQLNAATMVAGEQAEINLNFHKNLSYRLIICADSYFEGLKYQLVDETGTIFTEDTLKGLSSITDIEVSESSNLKLLIETPKRESTTGIVRNGCVSILIGFKE